MNRRGFLGTCLALGVAPAIVRADSLMRIVTREWSAAIPQVWGTVRTAAYFTFMGELMETESTTLLDGRSTYTYDATDLCLAVPHSSEIKRVWANGILIPNDLMRFSDGRIEIPRLDLTPYGNNIPAIEAEVMFPIDKHVDTGAH